MKVHAIIVAAGKGTRVSGSTPKQFRTLGQRQVFEWSLNVLHTHPEVDTICLVMPSSEAATHIADREKLIITAGGHTRSQSVRNGLESLDAQEDDIVLIHDAARPGLAPALISALISSLETADAAAPALPVTDALKRRSDAGLENVDRHELFRIQTPQAFRFGQISAALSNTTDDFVDDLAAIESLGAKVALIDGDRTLDKITYEKDFDIMTQLLDVGSSPVRVGTGFDVHGFEPGDHVTICGTKIPHDQALAGHSDADVGWHALTDAIFGALALGDLGDHFPPSDPKWKDADSGIFLSHALSLAANAGWQLDSCDITIICEAPKVKPHRQAMREATATLAQLPLDRISIKATTTEGLGFTGRKEGIAAQAIATLCRKPA
ncbi:bifunctional 2-C-methyl-D-erythritol 4-phosphate cytidylyltransferase/2-C-methyl-D-erythritol 2,4-cyclodiphosphate synthase [Henriciella sp. AS95]|uniref:bifunctional 2-C-methyl-D-erythritol 4-phosphate cytidylyltransferase/2-C-methyl-D-erythritol 2,4-cyclodiphosphate synthase n=1 Tax=Henriciella sp. AS95 TaxID=3135782 RepID=UPI00316CB961